MNYWTIFFTGLTAGGFSCLALQGGLLAAALTTTAEKENRTPDWIPTAVFLLGKILAYSILGGLLGLFGSVFQLSATIKIIFIVSASILMLGLAGNMLNLHPIFRYFVITPPKWAARLLRKQSNLFLLGALTIFIPCGVTQAMEVQAISSGNIFAGALTMFFFILGTAPVFMALGYITTRLSENFRAKFFKIAGILVIFIALSNLNAALVLANSPYTWQNFTWAFKQTFSSKNQDSIINNQIVITATSGGYSPRNFTVKNNQEVTLTINSQNNRTCARAFTIPALGISRLLPVNGTEEIKFTPTQTGRIVFSCSMGMFTGVFNVVSNNKTGTNQPETAVQNQAAAINNTASAPTQNGASCAGAGGGCGCGGGGKTAAAKPAVAGQATQEGTVQVIKTAYTSDRDISPNEFTVKAGGKVRMEIDVKDNGSGCMSTITVPRLVDDPQYLAKGKTIVFEFTPVSPGNYPITCAMGVPRGVIKVT